MTTQIYVGNMNYKIEEVDLGELFEQYGAVNNVRIISDRKTLQSKGFGFVEMEDGEEAKQAIQALNEASWKDRIIIVNIARERIERFNFNY